jgi:hypothetical protein
MARRKKSKRRRSPKTMSIISMAESYAYVALLTEGIFNNTPVGFITGKDDITLGPTATYSGVFATALADGYADSTGVNTLSLSEMINEPTIAFAVSSANLQNHWQGMFVKSLGIKIGVKLTRKLLRAPISNVNRNIMKPLGMGVRI